MSQKRWRRDRWRKDQWQVPWQAASEFQEAVGFFRAMDQKRGGQLLPVKSLARKIEQAYLSMAGDLNRLCAATCPGCTDNCCERALIWYDFRDLLYLYFSQQHPDINGEINRQTNREGCRDAGPWQMPGQQIVKSGSRCPNLGHGGCRLPRQRRPFVCSWYFCPAQKARPEFYSLREMVGEIKALRVKMEEVFCQIAGGTDTGSGRL